MSDEWLIRSPQEDAPFLAAASIEEARRSLHRSDRGDLEPLPCSPPASAEREAAWVPEGAEPDAKSALAGDPNAYREQIAELPDPELPDPELPATELPDPELPDPELPDLELSDPELPAELPGPEELEEPTPESEPLGPRCPYCRDPLHEAVAGHQHEERAAERTMACTECQTPVHARCVQIHGRCVINGCSGRSFAFVDSVPRPQIRTARIRPRARRRARTREPRQPRQIPDCPPDWVRRDAPLLVLGVVGILSLALFGDSLAEGARAFGEFHARVTSE